MEQEKCQARVVGREGTHTRFMLLNPGMDNVSLRTTYLQKFLFPADEVDEEGNLKPGVCISLIFTNGRAWVVDKSLYPTRKFKHMTLEELYKDTVVVKKWDKDSEISEFVKWLNCASQEEQEKALNRVQAEGKNNPDLYRDIVCPVKLPQKEDLCNEFKQSIMHSSNPGNPSNHFSILATLIAFYHTQGGDIWVGLKNDASISDLTNEFLNEVPFENKTDFVNDFINRASQATQNYDFVRSLSFTFYRTEEHNQFFFRISVPKGKDIVLIRGEQIFVRTEGGTRRLKYQDHINFIQSRKSN